MNTRKLIWVVISLLALGGVLFVGGIVCGIYRRMRPPTSAPTPKQQLLPGGITVRGKHIVVHAPAAEQRNAEHLVTLGNEILETYSRYWPAALPQEPIPYYLLDTVQDYEHAANLYNNGAARYNWAFSRGGRTFVYMQPRPGQTVIHEGDKMEQLMAHELCHTFHQYLVSNYNYQPPWLIEGVAEAWSERALSRNDSTLTSCNPYYGTCIITLRHALQSKRFLPISQLMQTKSQDFYAQDWFSRYLRYAESYALIRMLDDPAPANAVRRKTFRQFLNEVNTLPPDEVLSKANARFLALFGTPDLNGLQNELIHRIQAEKVFPWETYANQICALTGEEAPRGDALEAEAFPKCSALAFRDAPAICPGFRIKAQAQSDNSGMPQVTLLFGRIAENDYYCVFYGPGYVTLSHYRNAYQTLASQPLNANRFTPGLHKVDVKVMPHWVEARLDGKIAAEFALGPDVFPAGQWGVGCYDGRVIFRDIRMQPLPDEEKEGTVISNTEGVPVLFIQQTSTPF